MDADSDKDITSNLTLRGIPASVRRTLAARAKARRMSLNSYVIERLTQDAEAPTMAEAIATLDVTRRQYGFASDDVVAVVREARDERDASWG